MAPGQNEVDKFSRLRQQAETVVEEQPQDLSDYSPQELQRLVHELKVHQVELELQNEELRLTQLERELAQKNYADLYDSAPVGYMTLDEDGLILEANLTSAEVLGIMRNDLIGQRLSHFVAPEDQDTYHFYQQRLSKIATLLQAEIRLCQADGSQFHARLHGRRVIQPGEARVQQYRVVIGDITERVQAEEAYRALVDHSLQGLAIFEGADRGVRLVFANPGLSRIGGYSTLELMSMAPDQLEALIHPEDRARVWERARAYLAGKPVSPRLEFRLICKAGLARWVEGYANRIEYRGKPAIQIAFIDITERKGAEAALRESETFNRAVLNSLIAHIAVLDKMGTIIAVNEAWQAFTYENGGEAFLTRTGVGINYLDICRRVRGEDAGLAREALNQIQAVLDGSKEPLTLEYPCHSPTEQRWFLMYATPLTTEGGGAVVSHINITERKQAEEVRAYLAAIVDSSDDAIIGKTLEGRVASWNRGAEHLYGYRAEEMIGHSITRVFLPERHHELPQMMARIRQGESIKNYETQRITKEGKRLIIALTLSPIKDSAGRLLGASVIARDITVRKQTELELAQLLEAVSEQREQLRTVTGQLAEAQEIERKALARELHDQVGQKLTALNLNLNALRTRLTKIPVPPDPIMTVLEQSLKLVEETTERIQNLMTDLRPPMLDDYGLLAALRWYGAEVAAQMNFAVVVQGQEPDPRLPAPVEHALFRITQEALTNVVKHAQAAQVTISLAEDKGTVRLVIADDGRGFRPARPKPGERPGWGLLTMAERAEAVGARCAIKSRLGQGSQVMVEVDR